MHNAHVVRLSVFNHYVEHYPEPGVTLVYNAFTGAFAEVPAELMAVLRRLDERGEATADELASIDQDLLDEDSGFVVQSRHAEEQAYRQWHERQRSDTEKLSAMVSTTFACNLDCTYCCQADVLDGRTMSSETADATATWLVSRAAEIGARTVALDFVGGEPLLHPDRIERIVRHVGQHARVEFSLITNGVFLSPQLVERWIPLGLNFAKVTLDGDESTHSISRRSKRVGENTFHTVFHHVIEAAKRIPVYVNGNYQTDTLAGFVPLLDKLREAGLAPGSKVRFGPAVAGLGAPEGSASGSCTLSGSAPELMLRLFDETRRRGFDHGDPIDVGPCSFHDRHYYAVDPDGHLYKCEGFLGKHEWSIGHVATGLNARYDGLANINAQRSCGSCGHRPHCSGGCIAAEWLRKGRTEGVNCEIGMFDRYGGELIKRKYAQLGGPEPADVPAPTDIPAPSVAVRVGGRVALRLIAA